jgi:hypothetical protein
MREADLKPGVSISLESRHEGRRDGTADVRPACGGAGSPYRPAGTSAEGSDNLSKAYAKSLATEKAMGDRFPDYQSRYQLRYP